ncbi:MAG: CBS domain-containing protein [Candidatus Aenigmatarchaeota archaeon]
MLVSEIMTREVFAVKPSDSITTFVSLMEKEHIHESPVIDGKKLIGMVKFDTLVARGITNPSKQKINSIMDFPPPTLKPDQSVEEAAEILFKTGLRALPVVEENKVTGLVAIWDVLDVAAGTKAFRQTTAGAIMSVAEVVGRDSDIGTARVIMRERNISRLPVVDEAGKLVGILGTMDLIKAIKRPREKMTWYGMAAEMERVVSLPVSNVMNDHPPTAKKTDSLTDVVRIMNSRKCSGVTVTEGDVPIGVVTIKDLLEVYIAGLAQKGVYYHAIGLEKEDEAVADTVQRMIADTIQKIAYIVPVQFAMVHFKKHEAGGLKAKWSVRVRVMTDRGVFMAKAWAWDPRDAIGKALNHLERSLIKWKEEKTTVLKKNIRKFKEAAKLEIR